MALGNESDIAGDERSVVRDTLKDLTPPPRPRGRPRDQRLDAEILPLLHHGARRVRVQRRDARGRRRGFYWRTDYHSRRAIAVIACCSHNAVNRRFYDFLRGTGNQVAANKNR